MAHEIAPTEVFALTASERTASLVLDSLDVMTQVLDFLEAPTVFGARATSSTLRAAGDKVPGRISLNTFNSISASLFCRGHIEYEDGYGSDDSWLSTGPRGEWVNDECSIDDYYYGDTDRVTHQPIGPREDDLKHLIALVEPEITFDDYHSGVTTCAAPNGKWFTVGDLFEAIAKHQAKIRAGESDHVFFEGMSIWRSAERLGLRRVVRVYASVHWGS